jgi:excisionase family DNA binding protein
MYSVNETLQTESMECVAMPRVYKTEELRRIFQVKTKQTVLRWIKSGNLKASKIGRDYIVLEKDLEDFLEKKGITLKELTENQLSLWGDRGLDD